ncbi:MAG: hypothetical protein HW391_1237, partial [Chloroflexi bacterium]|nr:hypothetical protein [Chloroflexota bacterium]
EFVVAEAAIRVGRSEEHQAIVPLARDAQTPVTLEPLAFPLTGKAQAGDLRVTVRNAEIRYDLPDVGLQLPRSSVALILTYDASFRSDFSGGFPFTAANLGLVLPTGETIAARSDGHSAPAVVLPPGTVVAGLQSRFEVPADGIGVYHLVIRDGAVTRSLELSIAGL